ncbi:MAG: hypothetical protein HC902_10140 [Calothrix sp. SM1_5_4]|nr:hypothetical protein [Calothrix sp. SM1_5_4]
MGGLIQVILMTLLLAFAQPRLAVAATYKGKKLDYDKFKAELQLENGAIVKGRVKFTKGRKAIFTAAHGADVAIRIRSICVQGPEDKLDDCWPKLKIELDDLSTRTGILTILK